MEVDVPVNGFAATSNHSSAYDHHRHNSTTGGGISPTVNHVQFNSTTEIRTYKVAKPQPHQPSSAANNSMEHQTTSHLPQQFRSKHKSRRRARVPKLDLVQGDGGGHDINNEEKPLSPSKLWKMSDKDRHSRTGRRGLPKKGGAGGKGTWGKLTEMYDEQGHAQDSNDPNYDSVEEEESYLVSPSSPQIDFREFEKQATVIFKEYFNHGDTQEVADSLNEFNIRNLKHEVVHILMAVALEEKPANRELASILLSDLYGHVINCQDTMLGFDAVLDQLSELSLDTPDAPHVVGNFIARSVADDCLPPAYVTNHSEVSNPKIVEALKRASLLLNMKHGIARLDNVWGVGGGQRPVMFLVNKMNLLLKEYLSSCDCQEAVRCLRDLEVPHFHHELVHEAVVLVLEDAKDETASMICKLLQYMSVTAIVTQDQFNCGFRRVFEDMPDIVLDAPNAYHTLSKFVDKGMAAGFVSQMVAEQLPSRGRKRYVSEGDGGAIKTPED